MAGAGTTLPLDISPGLSDKKISRGQRNYTYLGMIGGILLSATKRATWEQIQDKVASLAGEGRTCERAEHARGQALDTRTRMVSALVPVS